MVLSEISYFLCSVSIVTERSPRSNPKVFAFIFRICTCTPYIKSPVEKVLPTFVWYRLTCANFIQQVRWLPFSSFYFCFLPIGSLSLFLSIRDICANLHLPSFWLEICLRLVHRIISPPNIVFACKHHSWYFYYCSPCCNIYFHSVCRVACCFAAPCHFRVTSYFVLTRNKFSMFTSSAIIELINSD